MTGNRHEKAREEFARSDPAVDAANAGAVVADTAGAFFGLLGLVAGLAAGVLIWFRRRPTKVDSDERAG